MLKKSLFTAIFILGAMIAADAQSLKFSPDGNTLSVNLIVDFNDYKTVNQFIFFDVSTGKIKSSVNVPEAEIEDPKMLFTAGNQSLLISDRSNLSLIKLTADNKAENKGFFNDLESYDKEFIDLAISDDNKVFFKLYSGELKAFNALSQTILPESGRIVSAPEGENTKAEFIAVQENGQMLVEFQKKSTEHFLVVHNPAAKTANKIIKLPYEFEAEEIKFSGKLSQNGERLALKYQTNTDESQITLWDLKTGLTLGTFSLPSIETQKTADLYPIENFAFSPDGRKLAVKIHDQFEEQLNNLLVVWDIASKQETIIEAKKYSEEKFAGGIAFSPDSKTLAIFSEVLLPNQFSAKIQLFDAGNGKFIKEF